MAPCKRTLILSSGAFRRPAAADELLDEPIAVIALDLDAASAARAPGAAAFLEFRRERSGKPSPVMTVTPLPLRPWVSRLTRTVPPPVVLPGVPRLQMHSRMGRRQLGQRSPMPVV
jgi:hypothetical protein